MTPTWTDRLALLDEARAAGMRRKEIKEKLARSAGIGETYADKLMVGPQGRNHCPRVSYAIWRCWNLDFRGVDIGEKEQG
jgi:hypothetical protein